MAPHSSTLAWKIPWMEEPGRLQSMGSLESDMTERLHVHFSLSCTGEGNGSPLQCSCLENPRDGGPWWAAVYGVAQSQTRLKQLSSSKGIFLKGQFSSVAQSCPTLCDPMNRSMPASLSITNSQSSPKPMFIMSVMPCNHLILCHPLLLLPSVFPSIRVFSNESAFHIRWPKYWSFSFNISPSSEHLGLISFRMDWLDLLAVQGTLKSLLQHHR